VTERAVAIALTALRVGGGFAAKVFDGPEVGELLARLRKAFGGARLLRPQATRAHSKEVYLIATDLRGEGG